MRRFLLRHPLDELQYACAVNAASQALHDIEPKRIDFFVWPFLRVEFFFCVVLNFAEFKYANSLRMCEHSDDDDNDDNDLSGMVCSARDYCASFH